MARRTFSGDSDALVGGVRWSGLIAFTVAVAIGAAGAFPQPAHGAKTLVNSFGSGGGAEGEFLGGPGGIAVNESGVGGVEPGTLYAVDVNAHRVLRFSPVGAFLSTWGWGVADGSPEFQVCVPSEETPCGEGISGDGAGQLSQPQDVAIDQASGTVYVSERGNARISAYSAEGQFLGAWGYGVLDGSHELQVCVAECERGWAGSVTEQPAGVLSTPTGMGIDPASGAVHVADPGVFHRRIDVFAPTVSGNALSSVAFLRAFGWGVADGSPEFQVCSTTCVPHAGVGAGPGQFGSAAPVDVAVAAEGEVYALDAGASAENPGNNRIQAFDSTPSPAEPSFGSVALATVFGGGALGPIALEPESGRLLVSGAAVGESEQIRLAELGEAGELIATHGTNIQSSYQVHRAAVTGLALAPEAIGGNLYVGTRQGNSFNGIHVLNEAPAIETLDCGATTAHLAGTVVSNGFDVSYHFEYFRETEGSSGEEPQWERVPEDDIELGSGATTFEVERDIGSLSAGQRYHFRLVTNRPQGGGVAFSEIVSCETDEFAPPGVEGTTASAVTSTSATLGAFLNPQGRPTRFHFEYGTGPADRLDAPVPDAVLPAGGSAVWIAVDIHGLTPNTTYEFRLVAENCEGEAEGSECTTEGPERTFTTYPAPLTGLPDDRAYELVSPRFTGGVDVKAPPAVQNVPSVGVPLRHVAEGGDGIMFETIFSRMPGFPSSGTTDLFVARRGASGWQTTYVGPPAGEIAYAGQVYPLGASADLRSFFFMTSSGTLGGGDDDQPAGEDVFVRRADGGFDRVSRGSLHDPLLPQAGKMPAWGAASADGAIAVFTWARRLEPDALDQDSSPGRGNVYKRQQDQTLVESRLPAGAAAASASFGGMSRDSSVVAFLAPDESTATRRLFARINSALTVEVSASQAGDVPQDVRYEDMSADGSRIVFSTRERLLEADVDGSRDIYAYEVPSESLSLVSQGQGGTGHSDACNPSPSLEGSTDCDVNLTAVSDDGARVYFLSPEVLDTAPMNGVSAQADRPNLYMRSQGGTRYIATLAGDDLTGAREGQSGLDAIRSLAQPVLRPVSLSADGSTMAFESRADLTSYDNTNPATGTAHNQIYLYLAGSDELLCASCRPSGLPPEGDAALKRVDAGSYHEVEVRNITASGDRLFFESRDRVVPGDRNSATDVYQYDLQSRRVDLVTPGVGQYGARLAGSSADGVDVYFSTRQTLLPDDRNGVALKVYDARVGGGFAQEPSQEPCEGDGCQASPAEPPGLGHPASEADLTRRRSPLLRCARLVRRGAALQRRARKVRRRARRVKSGLRARKAKRRASRVLRRAKRLRRRAARCRAGGDRGGRR